MNQSDKEQPVKGQLISKSNCKAVNSSKKGMNEFIFTNMRRVFACFLEEIEDTKKTFRNYLTFREKENNKIECKEIARQYIFFYFRNPFG